MRGQKLVRGSNEASRVLTLLAWVLTLLAWVLTLLASLNTLMTIPSTRLAIKRPFTNSYLNEDRL